MGTVGTEERPAAIEAFCLLSLVGALITPIIVIGSFADATNPRWYPPFLSVYVVTVLLCLVGIWMMRRRALHVYMAAVLVNQVVHLAMGRWNPLSLLLPLFLIGYALYHIKKFR